MQHPHVRSHDGVVRLEFRWERTNRSVVSSTCRLMRKVRKNSSLSGKFISSAKTAISIADTVTGLIHG